MDVGSWPTQDSKVGSDVPRGRRSRQAYFTVTETELPIAAAVWVTGPLIAPT